MNRCVCCGYKTIDERADYEICPVCFWENDALDISELYTPSGANHGLTIKEGRVNYREFGACKIDFIGNVRPPKDEEK